MDFESKKITRTTLSTTVAELYSFMKCFGTCLYLRGLWKDLTGNTVEIHMRTDANNLVTTALTTHLPEQQETVHMIQMLRKESCSGQMEDLSHIVTKYCLSDSLTKKSADPEELTRAVQTGRLLQIDVHPLFRSLLPHKAYWMDFSEADIAEQGLHTCHGEEQLQSQRDYWVDGETYMIRMHVLPRKRTFAP